MKRQKHLDLRCKRCGIGTLLSGDSRQYNPKSKDGSEICSECKYQEIMECWCR